MTAADGALPIVTRSLSKTYRLGFLMNRRVQALRGLDLSIKPGQVFGLLGPNGAGKSTAIKILMNLVRASEGEAFVFGLPPSDPAARRKVGFLPENPMPYEYLTGREFVTLAGDLCGLAGKDRDSRVKEVLGRVGMEKSADLQIRRYSKGMVQRIGLAQAIVHRPELLVLDEPTSGLDPVGRREIRNLILEERQRGTTILFCTHIISDVEALCDEVAVLVASRKVREGKVKDLLTGQTPQVEITTLGVGFDRLHGPEWENAKVSEQEDKLVLRVKAEEADRLIRTVLDAKGKIVQLQPVRFSLEDLFLEAVQEVKGGAVGGDIS